MDRWITGLDVLPDFDLRNALFLSFLQKLSKKPKLSSGERRARQRVLTEFSKKSLAIHFWVGIDSDICIGDGEKSENETCGKYSICG